MEHRDCDLGEAYPPFSRYTKELSHSYPELAPLAQLLTGKYPPSTTCLTWSTSSNVDVIMVDVKILPAKPNIEHILDIDTLKQYAVLEVPADVSMRVFLIEDVSADVINILGSVYGSYPHFFENHMHTIGNRSLRKIDINGYPVLNEKASSSIAHKGKLLTPNEIVCLPYFSLPFRRLFEYSSKLAQRIHRNQRTIFREYNEEGLSLEERVTGAIHSAENEAASIGIFLFDSIGSHHPGYKESSVKRGLFDILPCFSSNSATTCSMLGSEHSLRKAFLQQFKYDNFINAILEDNSTLLWAVMKSILGAWLEVVDHFDIDAHIDSEDFHFTDNNWMLWNLMDMHGLRQQNLAMLKHALVIIQAGGCITLQSREGTEAQKFIRSLEIDFADLITRTEHQLNGIQQRINTMAAVRSIIESEKAIKQSDKIGALTRLATFYIPLSFVSSLLGMNVVEISSQNTSIWVFFIIAVPLTIISLIALANWETLQTGWEYLFSDNKFKFSTSRRTRWKIVWRRIISRLWTLALKLGDIRKLLQREGKPDSNP